MSKQYNQTGVGATIEFAKGGPRFKDNAGAIEARNNLDTDFVNVRGSDAVIDDDFVTKRQLDAASASGVIATRRAVFDFNTASPFNVGSALPAGAIIIRVRIAVNVAFDDPTAVVNIGVTGVPSIIMVDIENDLTLADLYVKDVLDLEPPNDQIVGNLTAGASTQGEAAVTVEFISP